MLQYFSQHKPLEDLQYSLEDFLFRWKKMQRVLSKEGVDGLLLATGLDARDCVHSAYLFNWLFLGLSGRSITLNKYLDPIYSEIIIVVNSNQNYVFITPEAKAQLETLIYAIPNCTVFCPTQKEYANKQLLDTLKIAYFYQMTENIKKIGIFLGENEDVKTIEKWPLIQSYALEPVGKTFFTLKHQAVNIGSKILPLFKNFDKHSLRNLASRTVYSLEGHIKGSVTSIELKSMKERGNISEKLLQESLQQAVDIGLFESGASQYKGLVRVLFGNNTNSNDKVSTQSTINQEHAEHFTIQHYDPYTKLKVWRTYFLNIAKKFERIVELETVEEEDTFLTTTKYSLKEKKNVYYGDQSCLITLYSVLVQSVFDSISSVSKDYKNLNKEFIHQFIMNKINQITQQIYNSKILKNQDLEVEIESFDSFGEPRPIDFKDSISFKLASTFYCIKCRLHNIVSPSNHQNKLGALLFSQSFILQEGCFLLLTKDIPYFDFWKCGGAIDETLGELNPNYQFEKLGKPISDIAFKNRIFIPCQKVSSSHFNIPILEVKYYFHENGLKIFNEKIGWQIIFYNQMKDLTMINKISGEWVLIKIDNPLILEPLQTNIIAIEFRGKPFDFLMNLTKRKDNPLLITYIDSIPPILSENWQFVEEIMKKTVKEGTLIHQHQILVKDFLWMFIESKQLMIINQMKDIKLANFKTIYQKKIEKKKQSVVQDAKHNILILNGSYGGGKHRLAQNIKRYGPNHINCNIFHIGPDNLYSRIEPEAFIEMVDDYIVDLGVKVSSNDVTIVIIPSWLNCTQIIPLLSEKFHIRSVLTKINSNNFFSNRNQNLVQNVLVFGLPGYSQNIVVDTFAEEQSLINSVIKIVGSFNKQARIARSTNSLLTTGQCADILEDTSYQGDYQLFLRQKYGTFYNFQKLAQSQIHYIEFNLPIKDLNKLKNLQKAEGFLLDRKAVIKQLEHKKKEAENSKDQLMMGLYFLEEVMAVVRKRQKVPKILSIKGHFNMCKEGQRQNTTLMNAYWANNELKQEEASDSGRPLGFSILSIGYDEIEVKNLIQSFSEKNSLFGEPEQIRTIDSLSEEERKQIQEYSIKNEKCFENGEYYDGYVLRNSEGFALEDHPNLQKALERWVTEENQRIMKHNNEIKIKWNEYSAKYK